MSCVTIVVYGCAAWDKQTLIVSFSPSGPRFESRLRSLPKLLSLDSALLIQWTMQSLIVVPTHLVLASGKLVLQNNLSRKHGINKKVEKPQQYFQVWWARDVTLHWSTPKIDFESATSLHWPAFSTLKHVGLSKFYTNFSRKKGSIFSPDKLTFTVAKFKDGSLYLKFCF